MVVPDDDLPKGLKRRTVDATPNVGDLFRGYVRGGYSIPDAIAEYVDNSIEQIGDRPGGRVEVDVAGGGSGIVTTIRDNGGGCRDSDALRFIQPGNTGTTELSRGISRFGMGGKTAGLSVAKQVRVYSRFPGENGFLVILDRNELMTKPNWHFEVYDIPQGVPVKSGETLVELRGMETEAHAKRDSYRERFSKRYAALLRRPNSPVLKVAGLPVPPRDPEELMLKGAE
ncbi:ATPase, partial [mine drainage metagenome]